MTLDELFEYIIENFRLKGKKVFVFDRLRGRCVYELVPTNGLVKIEGYNVDFPFIIEVLERHGL